MDRPAVFRRCYEDATRMIATLRLSRVHVKMVCRVANMSATNHACRARWIWRTTRQTDKRAADRRPQLSRGSRWHPRNICYEEITRTLLPWNFALRIKKRQSRVEAEERVGSSWRCATDLTLQKSDSDGANLDRKWRHNVPPRRRRHMERGHTSVSCQY